MSATHNHTPAHAGGHQEHDESHHTHADHGSVKSYLTGFILAVILTAIPFWIVLGKVFESSSTTALVVLGFAAVQIVVHMVYFLHMNTRSEGGWSILALIFTTILVVIMLSGSIWVMYHLNNNMMPGMMPDTTGETVTGSLPKPPAMHSMEGMKGMDGMKGMEGMNDMPATPAAPKAP
ncbi:MAG: cytochrome o ubiquinol oxidase operon protein cyoD [Candidatus Paceibacteria bacterium]